MNDSTVMENDALVPGSRRVLEPHSEKGPDVLLLLTVVVDPLNYSIISQSIRGTFKDRHANLTFSVTLVLL